MSITRDYRRFLGTAVPPPPPPTVKQIMSIAWVAAPGTAVAWTNMPAALTEVYGTTIRRFRVNLSGTTQYCMGMNQSISGATTARLGLQYSLDNATTWKGMDNGVSNSPGTTLLEANTVNSGKVSNWATIATEAQTTHVLIRIVGVSGNGAADPSFNNGNVFLR